jgi:integrase
LLALLLYTAQRSSDVVRMGRQHVREALLCVTQQKTGTPLAIPVHPTLAAVIDATPSQHLAFLATEYGKPFSADGFGHWFRDRCNEAGLPKPCTAHGLRKAACRRLAEAGCSASIIASISGHKTLREVERYTKAADQARMAKAGIAATVTAFPAGTEIATSGVKPDGKV